MVRASSIAAGAALFGVLSLTAEAFAQRVLLVEPDERDATLTEAFNRLRAELLLQDFEVVTLESNEPVSPATLEAAARDREAFAAILLTRSAGDTTADVAIADRVTGKTSQRRLAITDRTQAPRVLAVRAVDLLRSSLREFSPDERPPDDVLGVQPEPAAGRVHEWSAETMRFRLRAAGAALGGASELGTAFGGLLGFSFRPLPWIGVGLVAAGPLMGARYEAAAGTASVRQELGLVTGSADLIGDARFELGPALGAGLYHLMAQGEVEAPLRARSAGVFSFAGSAGVEAAFRLTPVLSLSGSLSALLLSPRPVVALAEAEAPLALPILLASLGVEVRF